MSPTDYEMVEQGYDAMDEQQLESQSRLLIELGEPETWLETMLRASKRSATYEASIGNDELATRWRNLVKGLEYAVAATVHDPFAGQHQSPAGLEPMDTRTQSQATDQLVGAAKTSDNTV